MYRYSGDKRCAHVYTACRARKSVRLRCGRRARVRPLPFYSTVKPRAFLAISQYGTRGRLPILRLILIIDFI